MNDVKVISFEEQNVYSIRKTGSVYEMPEVIGELFKTVKEKNLEVVGHVFTIYYDEEFDPNKTDYEICVPIKNADEFITNTIKSGKFAVIVHKGKYDNISSSYEKIMKWIDENNYLVANPPNEVYIKGITDTENVDDYMTEIRFPVIKK
ncbi:MAG: GyrI-like domain-containing protein [Clostridiales bacterium]